MQEGPIGIFDSGYGGLTILKEIKKQLPIYDYLYLGDNARAPYGPRSFETVYEYTLQAVKWFFENGCNLVILACNTASAKALRTIQQQYLPIHAPGKRVLGVIRPTAEDIGLYSNTKHVGILATEGTVLSHSYVIEIGKFYPVLKVTQLACPRWVPIVENNEQHTALASAIIEEDLKTILSIDPEIDVLLLACTHYPLLLPVIHKYIDENITVISQGNIIAEKLQRYLTTHFSLEKLCTKTNSIQFFTTGSTRNFEEHASSFFGETVQVIKTDL